MRAVLQRVQLGHVSVDDEVVGEIGPGLVILVGVTHGDGAMQARKLARKAANLRIFEDEVGKMNLSVLDMGASILVVSQFTLYADCKRGRRPGFSQASPPDVAEPIIEEFAAALREMGVDRVETGAFGMHMLVRIHNDGPVTIILDTDQL